MLGESSLKEGGTISQHCRLRPKFRKTPSLSTSASAGTRSIFSISSHQEAKLRILAFEKLRGFEGEKLKTKFFFHLSTEITKPDVETYTRK